MQATRAPNALASWIAIVPIPLLPPCTSSISPSARPASWKTLEYTVHAVSGNAAAMDVSTLPGTGSSCPAGTATCSA